MQQLDVFDDFARRGLAAGQAAGEALKAAGLDRVMARNCEWITAMRAEAIRLSQANGCVTVDELRAFALQHGSVPTHDNAWGGIFRGPRWKAIGRRKSQWPSSHAREVKIWRYVAPAVELGSIRG
jgi:hypothetical protein